MTKEQVIAAIKKLEKELGQTPTLGQVCRKVKQHKYKVLKYFYTYHEAVKAAGLTPLGSGHTLQMRPLFTAWAQLTRKLGRIPTISDWKRQKRYSEQPLMRRFQRWSQVPRGMMLFAKDDGLENKWQDVMEIISAHLAHNGRPPKRLEAHEYNIVAARPRKRLPIYGAPLFPSAMTCAPTNESGVIFLFGALCRELGFVANKVQTEYPDWEGLRMLQDDRWQKMRIEIEYESKNFVLHGHDIKNCDMIVCWRHNWPKCPVEVIELRKVVAKYLANPGYAG